MLNSTLSLATEGIRQCSFKSLSELAFERNKNESMGSKDKAFSIVKLGYYT